MPSQHFRNGPARRKSGSALDEFLKAWRAYPGLAEPEREHHFDPERKWRFDLAWPSLRTAVEVEGSTFSRSRHTSGVGFRRDCEKYNAATAAGWHVLRFTTEMLRDDPDGAVELVIAVMNGKAAIEVQS
jgi:hypothetical protein